MPRRIASSRLVLDPRRAGRAQRGDLERVGRGLYRHPDAPVTEHHSLALVGARYPDTRICLLSALQFHDLTTQWPRKAGIAREPGDWTPTASPVELDVVRMSGASFTDGAETCETDGLERVSVRPRLPLEPHP
ncbi:MAG: hypothetical protein BRD28_05040 [Bacteroidetes bacterium QH_10_64_37]|nr:MAG: hypothetical protein BRD28_05040 [Bacteroidetes bacterium QH_10_64_37]